MTLAKSQISLYVVIWVAVTTVLTSPVQAASLKDAEFPSSSKELKVKNISLFTPQPEIVSSKNTYTNYFDSDQFAYKLQMPVTKFSHTIAQLEEAAKITEDVVDGKIIYTYQGNNKTTIKTTSQSPNTTQYLSNRWQVPKASPRRRVPESSSIIGLLIFIGFVVNKQVKIK
ncbi:PEP-CTERM sorting domain-containing protein [Calothrix sp. PCC 6303]|uniref:PEP-CTERM sorting domain-containing protein n=1 Tax=Calothrix sp. PCC 6303 TaxID=1170562 RepID=UPI0002A044F3|nr:PEP-CTERM sorting domain-containing protein [Calothrix sp. PCC 6303]AFZ01149.1 PEP motif putative anchor domain protein [Calothrix sp. PCC 6303]